MRKLLTLLCALCALCFAPYTACAETEAELDAKEAAIDAALPPIELADMLEKLMPYVSDRSGYLTWGFLADITDIFWPDTPEKLRLGNFEENWGRVKIRTAGKIFTSPVLTGYSRELPWSIHAYASDNVDIFLVRLQSGAWNIPRGASGTSFDIDVALACNPRLRAEKVATVGPESFQLTGYILRAKDRRPVVMQYRTSFLQGQPFFAIMLFYPLDTTPEVVRWLLENNQQEGFG